ncbi:phosphate/phosphite/phosphonate ABC transporter binding protein [Jannaschia seohaensis]|uniref:Phosphate/phosphite/phosphonate ABC transporter binding protein n=1 Tax=Jannaschia seohaensis TaxID=475081 RepID=A0A2Y9A0U0_9RHOB|nr:phosphate/phosphite/phosphonate ABC transporter binding protein [Jannaschia seohaensis]SSA38151.1 phosphate/phosphite/phosphonate ABC transporter binding protein [Jannaschia seohaensis]
MTSAALARGPVSQFNIGVLGGVNAQDRLTVNQCLADYTAEALGLDPSDVNIFTPADSGIAALSDVQGKVFGFGDPNSTSGFLIPSVEIPQATGASIESGGSFGEVTFTGGHEQTIVAVANGDIDAGMTWADGLGDWEDGYNSGALRRASDAGTVDKTDLVEIWRSKPIPEGPVILRTGLHEDVKATMIDLVANLHETERDCPMASLRARPPGSRRSPTRLTRPSSRSAAA